MAMAGLVVALCLGLVACFGDFVYLTNDDASIQATLSGANTGSPYPLHRFIGCLSSYAVAGLYALVPTVQWWYAYSMALLVVGMFLLSYGMLLRTEDRGVPLPLGVGLAVLVNCALTMYSVSRMNFTTVPTILGTGVLAWYVSTPRRRDVRVTIGAVALYVLALSHRDASAEVLACFLALGALYAAVSSNGFGVGALKSVAPLVCALVAVTVVFVPASKSIQASATTPQFQSFNHARVRYMDYPHDTYDENPELYASVDWDRTLYELVTNWCFLDERVNAESLGYLSEHSTKEPVAAEPQSLRASIDGILDSPKQAKVCLACWALAVLLSIAASAWRKDVVGAVAALLNLGASGALLAYQFAQGRILYRSLYVVLLPACVLGMLVALGQGTSRRRLPAVAMPVALIVVLLPLSFLSMRGTFDRDETQAMRDSSQVEAAIANYAIEHKPTLFIRHMGVSNCTDPGALYPYDKPYNVCSWGGSQFASDSFAAKLAANGLDRLDGTVFRSHDARFVSNVSLDEATADPDADVDSSLLAHATRWQQERYGAVGIAQEDTVCDGAYVYRFVYDPAAKEPYYHVVDGRLELVAQQ